MNRRSGKQNFIKAILWVSTLAIIWFIAVRFFDIPIHRYFALNKISGDLKETVKFFDSYNNVVPLLLLAATAAISAGSEKWRMIGHLLLGLLITSGLVWAGKLMISRQRPKWFEGESWSDTFAGFWPGLHNMKFQSMPSGDAAMGFCISFILANYFPKHRYILYILALGCAISRVALRYHYLSDVILGSALGYLSAQIVLYLSGRTKNK